jgi:hypothetical protein
MTLLSLHVSKENNDNPSQNSRSRGSVRTNHFWNKIIEDYSCRTCSSTTIIIIIIIIIIINIITVVVIVGNSVA